MALPSNSFPGSWVRSVLSPEGYAGGTNSWSTIGEQYKIELIK